MKYAGFWKRFCALFVDFIVLAPFMFLFVFLEDLSREVAIITVIPSTALYWFYNIYFHGRWGATLGKMAVQIKVVKESDGSNISFREALLRFSVDLVFSIISIIGQIAVLFSISSSEYLSLDWFQRVEMIQEKSPEWMSIVNILCQIWVWGELLVLLSNKRKRAIHDFIAGTVVIHKETQPGFEQPVPEDAHNNSRKV